MDFIPIETVSNEHREHDPGVLPVDPGDFMNAPRIEEIQVPREERDFTTFNLIFCGILRKRVVL